MVRSFALVVTLSIGVFASAQKVDQYRDLATKAILDSGVSNETINEMVRNGIASDDANIVHLVIRALGQLASHTAHELVSPHGPLPERSFQQVEGLKRFLMNHWYEQHEKSGYDVQKATFESLGTDAENPELNLTHLGFEETDEPSPDDIWEAFQERSLSWPRIPLILCVFWPGDPEVHTLLWDYHSRDLSPNTYLTILGLLNDGKFTTDRANAFRIDQLNDVGELAFVPVNFAVEGLALSHPVEALPGLISAFHNHSGTRGDILVTIAGYEDDELIPFLKELAPIINVNRNNLRPGKKLEALDRLQSLVK